MSRAGTAVVVFAVVAICGCDLVDPARPTPYPDTTVYGNLLEVVEPAEPGEGWIVRLRIGVPRELRRAEQAEGTPAPEVEDGLLAEVEVGADTVVVSDGRFASLDDIAPGTQIVVLPVLGTTRMVGSSSVLLEAKYLLDFDTYARWQLPKLDLGRSDPTVPRLDPVKINSDAIETAAVPVADGTVLYFTAKLRRTVDGGWTGAPRDGLEPVADAAPRRSFRTELGPLGWTEPAPVVFEDLSDGVEATVSWVGGDERTCLVTVVEPGAPPWVGTSSRDTAEGSWSEPERVDALGPADASDGVHLAGSDTMLLFVSSRDGGVQSDLYLHDPAMENTPLPLEPQLNTVGDEWGPRIGPEGELFFVRDDHQLLRSGGTLHEVRLPGPHRALITRAAPTADGRWVFLTLPRFTPLELDRDIWVAPRLGDGRLGPAVPVDDWRP